MHRIGRTGRAGREGVAITFVEPREHRLLRNIQFATKQKISVGTLPTVDDLRNRRLELTRAALQEAVQAGELDPFRKLVEDLASEFDPFDVAAAAVKLAHQASHDEEGARADEQDIPTPLPEPRSRGAQPWRDRGPERGPRAQGRGGSDARLEARAAVAGPSAEGGRDARSSGPRAAVHRLGPGRGAAPRRHRRRDRQRSRRPGLGDRRDRDRGRLLARRSAR